jgi:hypothetical protein
MTRWFLGLIVAALVGAGALVVTRPGAMIAPGPVADGHAGLANDCFACHVPLRGASAQRCVGCHAVAMIGLASTKGVKRASASPKTAFHQQLASKDCLACHTGHAGSALAFSHALLPAAAGAQCATCHAAPDTAVHRGAGANCGQCHGQQAWQPAAFDHARFFALEGPHAAPCATCHAGDDTSRFTCFGCHAHQPAAIRARHVREGMRNIENCAQCHRSRRGEHGGEHRGERPGERPGERKDDD